MGSEGIVIICIGVILYFVCTFIDSKKVRRKPPGSSRPEYSNSDGSEFSAPGIWESHHGHGGHGHGGHDFNFEGDGGHGGGDCGGADGASGHGGSGH